VPAFTGNNRLDAYLYQGKSNLLFCDNYEGTMKKTKITRSRNAAAQTPKAVQDPIYTDLLDKAMQASDDKIEKNVKFRPETVEVNHSFGKKSSGT